MPKAMTDAEIDPIAEAIDQQMLESGEDVTVAKHTVDLTGNFGDLSNGGMVGNARLTVQGESGRIQFDREKGFKREPGRPNVRAVWMWDGRPSTIPLSYESSGKRHDGGRKYLQKRHCTVCKYTGFYGQVCPQCRTAGRRLAPSVQAFYLKREEVPVKQKFFGDVDCIVATCVRRGEFGYLDEASMRQHAMSRHRQEYRAYQDAAQSRNDRELGELRTQLNALMVKTIQGAAPAIPPVQPVASARPGLSMSPSAIKTRLARAKQRAQHEAAGSAA